MAAPDWARRISPISSYHYRADPQVGSVDVRLLDAQERLLGLLRVSQRFGDPELVDGSMEAILDPEGPAPLRLSTIGQAVTREGYQVRARLSNGREEAEVVATFGTRSCWPADDQVSEAPPCAAGLPLGQPSYVLPSCGLIVDEFRLDGRPPILERLAYEVPAPSASASTAGGFLRGMGGDRSSLQVLGANGLRDVEEVERWLEETGVEALFSGERARLLTTAFLDRSWWRTVEQHFATCQWLEAPVDNAHSLQAGLETRRAQLRTPRSRCPGQHRSDEWAKARRDSPPSGGNRGAGLWGDPHLTTLDGLAYDFQGGGEYVLVESIHGAPLVVQGRFAPAPEKSEHATCENVTYAHAIAGAIGDQRFMVRSRPAWSLVWDDVPVSDASQLDDLPEGASIRFDENELSLEWPDGSVMTVSGRPKDDTLRLDIALAQERRGQVRGLLGNFNGDPTDDRALPDGTVLAPPLSFETTHRVLGPAWLVSEETSLFTYDQGDDVETYRLDAFPTGPARLEELPLELRLEAEGLCREGEVEDPDRLAACILDTICWGDDAFVEDAAKVPAPAATESPGGEVFATGDIRRILTPNQVAPWEEEVDRCGPAPTRTISLFQERTSEVLEEAVQVDAASPGLYEAEEDLRPEAIPPGTRVRSFLLHRGRLPEGAAPLQGKLRFDTPILGLAIEAPDLSDPQLGADGIPYQVEAFEALAWAGDMLRLSDDMHELELRWAGRAASRVRIITEAAEEAQK